MHNNFDIISNFVLESSRRPVLWKVSRMFSKPVLKFVSSSASIIDYNLWVVIIFVKGFLEEQKLFFICHFEFPQDQDAEN